ncbi:hypothetical protein [Halorussus lipolyticus]|uniref:hypothetical protein n=1 Tax=Halorussus lipolyticus TaxID=3034024 RepID=UPI0023E8EB42|nr:hypothetical protein [Halorussus sp. DT80]
MSNVRDDESNGLSPEQRLEPRNIRLIDPSIATIDDMDTLRACVAYENTHQNRIQILRRLKRRAEELRSEQANSSW